MQRWLSGGGCTHGSVESFRLPREAGAPQPAPANGASSRVCDTKVMESTPECRWAPLRYAEAFWLATVSGARALDWEHLTGDFSVGSDFDAVAIDPIALGSPFDLYDGEDASDAFQKWLQLGDDRNTSAVWVHGRQVLGSASCRQARAS